MTVLEEDYLFITINFIHSSQGSIYDIFHNSCKILKLKVNHSGGLKRGDFQHCYLQFQFTQKRKLKISFAWFIPNVVDSFRRKIF